jgi:hypothetical protein
MWARAPLLERKYVLPYTLKEIKITYTYTETILPIDYICARTYNRDKQLIVLVCECIRHYSYSF